MPKPNEKCHCGSNKKYKKCCSLADRMSGKSSSIGSNHQTLYQRGCHCENGSAGVAQDYAKAKEFYEQAAASSKTTDQRNAQCNLGFLHEKGLGCTVDLAQARTYYQIAAEKGSVQAQFNLGLLLEDGKGGEVDYDQALHWFEVCAQEQDCLETRVKAMLEGGRILHYGWSKKGRALNLAERCYRNALQVFTTQDKKWEADTFTKVNDELQGLLQLESTVADDEPSKGDKKVNKHRNTVCAECAVSLSSLRRPKMCNCKLGVYYCNSECQRKNWAAHKSKHRHALQQAKVAATALSNVACTMMMLEVPALKSLKTAKLDR